MTYISFFKYSSLPNFVGDHFSIKIIFIPNFKCLDLTALKISWYWEFFCYERSYEQTQSNHYSNVCIYCVNMKFSNEQTYRRTIWLIWTKNIVCPVRPTADLDTKFEVCSHHSWDILLTRTFAETERQTFFFENNYYETAQKVSQQNNKFHILYIYWIQQKYCLWSSTNNTIFLKELKQFFKLSTRNNRYRFSLFPLPFEFRYHMSFEREINRQFHETDTKETHCTYNQTTQADRSDIKPSDLHRIRWGWIIDTKRQ